MSQNSELGFLRVQGLKRFRRRESGAMYYPATLRNQSTGKRELVELFDPQDESNEKHLISTVNFDLNADVKSALGRFSKAEQRVLYRVFVQGQSVKEASKRSRRSVRSWERWIKDEALPTLREHLKDYAELFRKQGV